MWIHAYIYIAHFFLVPRQSCFPAVDGCSIWSIFSPNISVCVQRGGTHACVFYHLPLSTKTNTQSRAVRKRYMESGRNGEADRLKLKPRVVSSVLITGCHAEEALRRGRWRGKQAGQRVSEKLLLLLRRGAARRMSRHLGKWAGNGGMDNRRK